jgi:hypothetical protein
LYSFLFPLCQGRCREALEERLRGNNGFFLVFASRPSLSLERWLHLHGFFFVHFGCSLDEGCNTWG